MNKTDHKIPLFRVFTILALTFLVGTAVASFIKIDFLRSEQTLFCSIGLLFICAILNSILKNWPLTLAAYFFIFLLIGAINYSYFDYKNSPNLPHGESVEIEGKIVGKPQVDYKKQQVTLKITRLSSGENTINYKSGSLILVQLPHYPAVHYGDTVKFSGKIEKPGMIEGFDWGKYLKRYLTFGVVLQPQNAVALTDNLSAKEKVYKSLFSISDRMEESLNQLLPEPHASLAAGLILGLKRNIPDDFQNQLSIDGLTHIIALSGYNITIIVKALSVLLLGYLNRKKVFVLGLILIIGFVILTGASSSVIRAAIFSLFIIFGQTLGRRGDQTNLMLLAAIIMVALNPFILASDVGFQLSFLAFAGLIYLSPIVEKLISKSKASHLPAIIKSPLTETLAAQIAVLPLILVVFGRVSIIGPISNVAVLWIIPWAMAAVFIAGFLGMIFYPLGKLAALIAWPTLQYIIKAVEFFAKIPSASVSVPDKNWLIGFCLYLILIVATIFLARRNKLKLI